MTDRQASCGCRFDEDWILRFPCRVFAQTGSPDHHLAVAVADICQQLSRDPLAAVSERDVERALREHLRGTVALGGDNLATYRGGFHHGVRWREQHVGAETDWRTKVDAEMTLTLEEAEAYNEWARGFRLRPLGEMTDAGLAYMVKMWVYGRCAALAASLPGATAGEDGDAGTGAGSANTDRLRRAADRALDPGGDSGMADPEMAQVIAEAGEDGDDSGVAMGDDSYSGRNRDSGGSNLAGHLANDPVSPEMVVTPPVLLDRDAEFQRVWENSLFRQTQTTSWDRATARWFFDAAWTLLAGQQVEAGEGGDARTGTSNASADLLRTSGNRSLDYVADSGTVDPQVAQVTAAGEA